VAKRGLVKKWSENPKMQFVIGVDDVVRACTAAQIAMTGEIMFVCVWVC